MLTIVFDLDGTLIDTAPDLVDTLNIILKREGFAAVPFDAARPMIGGGARGMIERALKAEGLDATPNELERMFQAFIAKAGRSFRGVRSEHVDSPGARC